MNGHESRPDSIFFRALMSIYFFFLIVFGIFFIKKNGLTPYDLKKIDIELEYWEDCLNTNEWFSGKRIGKADYGFYGHVECMLSGLTDELIPLLKSKPKL